MDVTLQNISKRLGSFCLKDISLSLPGGYITGLIGQNGAGKTTLLRILLGLYRPDAGEVQIGGRSYPDQEIWIRERTGTVLLEELFERGLTLRENGAVYGRYFSKYRQEMFEDFLLRFALAPERRCDSLSRGSGSSCSLPLPCPMMHSSLFWTNRRAILTRSFEAFFLKYSRSLSGTEREAWCLPHI